MKTYFTRQRAFALLALGATLVAGACNRHTDAHHGDPNAQGVRLSFNGGAHVVTVLRGQTNVSLTLPAGSSATVTAQWLDVSQNVIADIDTDFELRITGRPFTRTGQFSGTISGLTTGANPVTVQLWHATHAHSDFSVPLSIVVM
jgi:hypothetical protein